MGNDPLKEYKYKERLELKEIESEVQKIDCPSCSTTVPADNLNIHTNIAKCNSCDGIFSFEKEVEKLSLNNDISQEILRPEGVELTHFQDDLDISVEAPWTTPEIIFISLFPFFVMMVTSIFIEIFPATTVNVSVMMTFWITSIVGYIAYFFIRKKHKVYIHIDDQDLNIERRPRKFVRDKKYSIADIDQVYMKNVTTSSGKKGAAIFMIVNDVNGQKHVELIKSVNSRTKAKYIEQEIEKHLGIKDRRIPDEGT